MHQWVSGCNGSTAPLSPQLYESMYLLGHDITDRFECVHESLVHAIDGGGAGMLGGEGVRQLVEE